MKYEEFWSARGLDFILPPDTKNPEGFDIAEVLLPLCPGVVLEVGCGTGRIAKMFDHDFYIGSDINSAALDVAKADLPTHYFLHQGDCDFTMPEVDTVLFYTVCLHIPDAMILDRLYTAGQSANRIVIAEIMNPKYRENRDPSQEYDISNQRSLTEYEELMHCIGFGLLSEKRLPYEFYPGEFITFAVFERK